MDQLHQEAVKTIAEKVRSFFDVRQPFKVYHGSTNSTRIQDWRADRVVDVSSLNRVLSIDAEAMTAVVEPNVPMDQLVDATLKYGLVPPVVMEFPGITVGGGLQGGAGESSSFKWGCFNRTLNWFEVVLADGTMVVASPEERADLFYGSAGAYGSLGVVTAAELKLVKAPKYVVLEYVSVGSFDEAVREVTAATKKGYDYVDGIMYAKNLGVIICGRLSDKPAGKVKRCRRARDQWFYLAVEGAARAGRLKTDSYPLVDYLFRYDRGAFWTGSYAFQRFGVPFNRLTRFVFNGLLKTRRMYLALDASGFSQQYVIQDLALPAESAAEFMDWVDQRLGFYPVWLCPLLPDGDSPLNCNYLPVEQVVNVGVWGPGPMDAGEFKAINRELEQTVSKLRGRKWLYANAYYPKGEFWQIFDLEWYEELRKTYRAESLPTVYDKTNVAGKPPVTVNAKRGVWRAVVGSKRLS